LAVFNLIPVPPLDGSHVLRHFLPDSLRRAYDMFGLVGILLLFFWGGGVLNALFSPALNGFMWVVRTVGHRLKDVSACSAVCARRASSTWEIMWVRSPTGSRCRTSTSATSAWRIGTH